MNELDKARLSLIPVLAEKDPTGHIGRTALMKYMYFLQTIRSVPLGYSFSMYSYGPFDSDVLADLSTAEAMGVVSSTQISFSGGYGYRIEPGENAEAIKRQAAGFLAEHKGDIDWLFAEFGGLNSADLELASTIIYVDREFSEDRLFHRRVEMIGLVNEIKPRFAREQIEKSFNSLLEKNLLVSV